MRQRFDDNRNLRIVGTLLVAFAPCAGCLHSATDPPSPKTPAELAAREAIIVYAHRLAESFDDAASQLESGALTTAADVNRHLQAANSDVRKQAFQPVDQLLNDALGGDKWNAEQARQCFRQISTGLRSLP